MISSCLHSWADLDPSGADRLETGAFPLGSTPDRHRELTGAGNRTILENARRLVSCGAPVEFRLPVIPEHTDDPVNLAAVAGLLRELGVERVHVLRYHALGEAKLARLGRGDEALSVRGCADDSMEQAAASLRAAGLEVIS